LRELFRRRGARGGAVDELGLQAERRIHGDTAGRHEPAAALTVVERNRRRAVADQ
jgi:hypothetical protein